MKINDIKTTYNHPLNKKRKIRSIFKYFLLGVRMRIYKNKMFVYSYIQNTKLLVGRKSTSSMLQYFNALNDFEEMSLLLHFLRDDDVFVDVGANIGVYSILASGVCDAKSIAFEPSRDAIEMLTSNIKINNLENKIKVINYAVGKEKGIVKFSKGLDAVNRVIRDEDKNIDYLEIKQDTLDNLLKDDFPSLMKIDVEGYELNVIKGANAILKNEKLKIILIETNGLSKKYQINESEIFSELKKYNFEAYQYLPLDRTLQKIEQFKNNNTIFIRDIEYVINRIEKSKEIKINEISI